MSLIEKLSTDFRQRCEVITTEQRSLIQLKAFERLPANTLAAKLGATVLTPDQFPNLPAEQVQRLLASDEWSGAIVCDRPLIIVYNPLHADTRYESKRVGFDPLTGLPKRQQINEDEATYLGGCLQIPKRGLLWATQRKMLLSEIAVYFGASEAMVQFRSNVTNVPVRY